MGQPVPSVKNCSKCGERKPTSEYYARADQKIDGACKACRRLQVREYARLNADKIKEHKRKYHREHKAQRVAAARAWALANPERRAAQIKKDRAKAWRLRRGFVLVRSAKVRARERGLPFNLSHSAIQKRIEAGRCELSGIPFDMKTKRAWNAPSLDRIEPQQGYVDGNIRVVLRSLNIMINDWGLDRTLAVVRAVENRRLATAHGLEA